MLIKLNPNDVILGRGGYNYKHPGNKAFKELAKACAPNYAKATRPMKYELSTQMVSFVMDANPPGRFLRKHQHGNGYEQVESAVAREKACQSLRDAVLELKNTSTKSDHVDYTTTLTSRALLDENENSSKFDAEQNKKQSSLTPAPSQYKMTGGGDEENKKKENTILMNPIQEKVLVPSSWKNKDDFNAPHDCVVRGRNEIFNNQQFFPSSRPLLPRNASSSSSENMNSYWCYQPTPSLLSYNSFEKTTPSLLSYNSLEKNHAAESCSSYYQEGEWYDSCSAASGSSNTPTTTTIFGPCYERHRMIPPPTKRIKRTKPPPHCIPIRHLPPCQSKTQNFKPPSMIQPQKIHYQSPHSSKLKFIQRLASLGGSNTTTVTTTDKAMPVLKPQSHRRVAPSSSSSSWPWPHTPDFCSTRMASPTRMIATQAHQHASTSFVTEAAPKKKSIFIKRYSTLKSTVKAPCDDSSIDHAAMDDLDLSRDFLDLRHCKSTSKSFDSFDSFHTPAAALLRR